MTIKSVSPRSVAPTRTAPPPPPPLPSPKVAVDRTTVSPEAKAPASAGAAQVTAGLAKTYGPEFHFQQPVSYQGPGGAALQPARTADGRLDLNRVSPQLVNALSPAERQEFFHSLEGVRGEVTFSEQGHPSHGSFAGAQGPLVANLASQDPSGRTLAGVFASAPRAVLGRRDWEDQAGRHLERAVADQLTLGQGELDNAALRDLGQLSQGVLRRSGQPQADFERLSAGAHQGLRAAGADLTATGAVEGALVGGLANSGKTVKNSLTAGFLSDALGAVPGAKVVIASAKGVTRATGEVSSHSSVSARRQLAADLSADYRLVLEREVRSGEVAPDAKSTVLESFQRGLNATGHVA